MQQNEKIIDGRAVAKQIRLKLKEKITALGGRRPGLAFILIGNDEASKAYVRMKKKGCEEVGILSHVLTLSAKISESELLAEIDHLNTAKEIDGILVQQPLPQHINTEKIVEAIDPKKDVDGFHPINMGKLLLGHTDGIVPCTPLGIIKLLRAYKVPTDGKEVVIVGRSNIVGKPLAALLCQKQPWANSTVTLAHSHTKNLAQVTARADILITALGSPGAITANMVKTGAVVIDVGMNRTPDALTGDVVFDEVLPIASLITPVPGGVGPMTIAMLLANTLKAYR
ncbi:MAG: bifunctional 5,10-methylenetetrahydrofolate dehydrogenase/5,10-methenyltetrahydrofolate cyclohydrolase [Chlamydiia bacterium]|nr:bifunctional 5,10-methylenetetrahydrofolate dehydrogenase/5,10-methenyltetrahydrofolate cyclohydrolase [Chlamydiia bacterium]MCP5508805.1 bifunctional 5,10-methylenetetrahydrofolate dehydrogenase/5,10-methenyltetrahydrofolate cyclohydrolase [Chlamydiales bacterium]HPE84804.1 bifunctional 5,10-methylenetetrahydrofolate dehydrogenase/5,10-methenyltetrahydrofolate cyclohydrolase [Chlamydiales bacterium]